MVEGKKLKERDYLERWVGGEARKSRFFAVHNRVPLRNASLAGADEDEVDIIILIRSSTR